MDATSVLLTNSRLDSISGGGIVSLNLLKSLQVISDVKLIVSKTPCDHNKYEGIRSECIDSMIWGYKEATPFFEDYLARCFIDDHDFDIAVSYGCPWGSTVEKLKKDSFCKIICDLAPHVIKESMKEHLQYGGSYNYPHLVNPFLLELYLRHLKLADKVVVHSHQSARYIMKEAGLKELPEVIPHGCNPPEKIAPLPEKFQPGYLGALGLDKGTNHLIDAILNSPPDITLIIGGRESQGLVINDKIKNKIKLLGGCGNVSDFYNQCSIGIFPSITEGFNICSLEMLSHGRPIIIGRGAGASELIEDGKQGFIVDGRDVKAIQEKITFFRDNPSELQKMGIEARKLAERHEWSKIRQQYINLYESLIK